MGFEIENLNLEENPYGWMDDVQRKDFWFYTFDIGIIALAETITPPLLWFLLIKSQSEAAGLDIMYTPNFVRGWYTMWIGNLITYGLASIFWVPAYFNQTAAHIYGIIWHYWTEMGAANIAMLAMIFFVVELINTTLGSTENKYVATTFVVYFAVEWLVMKLYFEKKDAAMIWYLWPKLEEQRAAEGNSDDGNSGELDDVVDDADDLVDDAESLFTVW